MILKQILEDFIVREIPGFSESNGSYSIFKLKKTNYTTEKAIWNICKALNIDRKRVGYAGLKDKNAITEQYISIDKIKKDKVESLTLKDLELEFICYSDKRINLGDLQGNQFEIVVRGLGENCCFETSTLIKNYFDEQRFSNNNAEIGKSIVKKDFKKAVELIIETDGDYELKVKEFLEKNKNNYIGALNKIPFKILVLFVHAYQSLIFNKTINQLNIHKNVKIPLVGFGTEFHDEFVEKTINNILFLEGIIESDFVIPQIPKLSCEGGQRDLYVEPENLEFSHVESDDLNEGEYKIKICFSLPKGAYATNVVKQLIL